MYVPKDVDGTITQAMLDSLDRHLCYLDPSLVPFALCDDGLVDKEKGTNRAAATGS